MIVYMARHLKRAGKILGEVRIIDLGLEKGRFTGVNRPILFYVSLACSRSQSGVTCPFFFR